MPLVAEKLAETSLVQPAFGQALPGHGAEAPAPQAESDRQPRGSFFFWVYPITLVSAMAFLLVLYLCQAASLVGLQYKMVQMQEKEALLRREKTELVLQVQELTSLSHIEHVAVTRLGMVLPKQRLVLDLSENMPREAMLKNVVAAHHVTP